MGLNESDPRPQSISLRDAYNIIRGWYRNNKHLCRVANNDYVMRSMALIDHLPTAETLSELEVRAILGEIIYGYLEWAYHESDGSFKMAAYAYAALEQAGFSAFLNDDEKLKLSSSKLWPYLWLSRPA